MSAAASTPAPTEAPAPSARERVEPEQLCGPTTAPQRFAAACDPPIDSEPDDAPMPLDVLAWLEYCESEPRYCNLAGLSHVRESQARLCERDARRERVGSLLLRHQHHYALGERTTATNYLTAALVELEGSDPLSRATLYRARHHLWWHSPREPLPERCVALMHARVEQVLLDTCRHDIDEYALANPSADERELCQLALDVECGLRVAEAGATKVERGDEAGLAAYLELIEGSGGCMNSEFTESIVVSAQQLANRLGDTARAAELRALWLLVQPDETLRDFCDPPERCGPDAIWKTPGDR